MRRLGVLLLLLLGAPDCFSPPVGPADDQIGAPPKASISGQVFFTGQARGEVIVLMYSADDPPPPFGHGSPRSLAVVPRTRLFPSDGEGPFSAPFTFNLVPAGTYLLSALLDRDECAVGGVGGCRKSDLIPWFFATNEPNAGDIPGGHVDLDSGSFLPITIASPAGAVSATPVEGVAVTLDERLAYPTDRPAFVVRGYSDSENLPTAKAPGGMALGDQMLALTLESAPLFSGAIDQRRSGFLVRYADEDHDGKPDDSDANGLPDLWPKIYVQKLAPALPEGLLSTEPVLLAAGLGPDAPYAELAGPDGAPDMEKTVQVQSLTLRVLPKALDVSNPPAVRPLEAVPAGRYGIIVQQYTGQTWRVPNESAPMLVKASDLGLPSIPGQGFFIDKR
ncbi:MAG: hypothetical protein HY901_12875 [Deltaproteobacteria bacterium]|nr:hypothetical protein [Deltaproteobacteria bacterium]